MALELWIPPETRPSYVFVSEDGEVEESGPELTDAEVYCDLCNADIPLRPVPVVSGYALCPDCLPKVEPEWEKQVSPLLKLLWQVQIEMAKASE